MKKVFVFTNIAPLYRKALWLKLLNSEKFKFHFVFGKQKYSGIKEININTEDFIPYKNQFYVIENYFFKRLNFWQSGVIKYCLKKNIDHAIFLGDFLVISTWIATLICRIRGIQVSSWSHGYYGNEKGFKKVLRSTFYRLANSHLLYERRGKDLMIKNGFNTNSLHVVFNSLDHAKSLSLRELIGHYSKEEICPYFSNNSDPLLLFVGRLTTVKKLNLLLEALNSLIISEYKLNLIIVGDGSERDSLISYVKSNKLQDHVYFYGPCYSEDLLSQIISVADLCVSPGNVGLTAIHCLSYGTPVCTHGNLNNQMPEVGSIIENKTGILFEENHVNSLAEAIKEWIFIKKHKREQIRKECFEIIDTYYNPNYQYEVFENLLENNPPLI